jgi:thymidylate synthase
VTEITITNLRDDYVELIRWLRDSGSPVESRGLPTLERTGVTLVCENVTGAVLLPVGVRRGINLRLAAVEALQIISGLSTPNLIRAAAPTFADVLVNPDNPDYGAYGPRVAPQLPDVLDVLRDDPASRRAVLSIWRPRDLTHDGDRPCTLTLQALVRDDKLELHVTMRSNDVWLGTPYDVFMFTQLQLSLARELGVSAGRYVHHVGSMHLYERNLDAARRLTAATRADDEYDYPAGIRTFDDEPFWDVADYLVNGTASVDEVEANRWYVDQLRMLGVTYDDDDEGDDEVNDE